LAKTVAALSDLHKAAIANAENRDVKGPAPEVEDHDGFSFAGLHLFSAEADRRGGGLWQQTQYLFLLIFPFVTSLGRVFIKTSGG